VTPTIQFVIAFENAIDLPRASGQGLEIRRLHFMQRLFAKKEMALMPALVLGVVILYVFPCQSSAVELPNPSPTLLARNDESSQETSSAFALLKGRWRRPDGGYVVDIKDIDPTGSMDTAYFNPRPIRVSKAEATRDGAVTKVFIELRDVGYPGSTYTLTYDPRTDQLKGLYFQAAIQQTFDVVFFRIK
jgi:hypothetical protein